MYFALCWPVSALEPDVLKGIFAVTAGFDRSTSPTCANASARSEVLKGIDLDVKRGEVIADHRQERVRQEHAAALCKRARGLSGRFVPR